MKIPRALSVIPCAIMLVQGAVHAQDAKPLPLNPADHAAATTAVGTLQVHHNVRQGVNRADVWASEHFHPASLTILGASPDIAVTSRYGGYDGLGPGFPSGFNLVVFPGYLSKPNNNPTLQFAQQHPLYVNPPVSPVPAHWGFPDVFLNELAGSNFIHVTDEYAGLIANRRYPLGTQLYGTIAEPHLMQDSDILALVHAAALAVGGGYGHVYHIFLAKGQDVCSGTGNTSCYSPDIPSSFQFCAYHASTTFADVGHVIFSVEPFQNVPGCRITGLPSPNGQLADSTASVLSHELFEAITDPDGNAWWNRDSLDLGGAEIGDECQSRTFNYGNVFLTTRSYELQSEYSNLYNGCTYNP
ncbi:MAG: hypothetical protein ACR2I2_06090 [Bryobacteraceae bacterium]